MDKIDHIALQVNDIKESLECIDHITEHRDGSWSKYVQDPSGNNIEIISYKKDKGN